MGKLWYEECRHKRMAENRKRMEALNLPPALSSSTNSLLQNLSVSKEASKVSRSRESSCRGQEVGSGGVASKPAPVYKESLAVLLSKMNLPKHDDVITLIDEEGDEYPTIYLARKTGLSGGWKGFAFAHE